MKYIEKNREELPFVSVCEGSCFFWQNDLYMKVEAILETNWNGEQSKTVYNAVRLSHGDMFYFENNYKVQVVDAHVTIN